MDCPANFGFRVQVGLGVSQVDRQLVNLPLIVARHLHHVEHLQSERKLSLRDLLLCFVPDPLSVVSI